MCPMRASCLTNLILKLITALTSDKVIRQFSRDTSSALDPNIIPLSDTLKSRSQETFRDVLCFYSEGLLNTAYSLSAVRIYLLPMFVANLHLSEPPPLSTKWTRVMRWWLETHLYENTPTLAIRFRPSDMFRSPGSGTSLVVMVQ
jgi:hypothetical protein